MIIYKITNLITNKVYIGQTIVSLVKRWGDHCSKGSNCTFISRSIQKHGKKNFTIEQIDSAETLEELNKKERYWIEFYDSTNQERGYNLSGGGDNRICHEETKKKISSSNTGKKRTEEVKEIFRQNNLGKKLSPEHVEKIRKANTGKKRKNPSKNKGVPRPKEVIEKCVATRKLKGNYGHTEESKKKLSESHKGLKQSEEHKKAISQKLKGVPKSEEAKENMRKAQENRRIKKELDK